MGASYNGYTWKQREAILREEKRLLKVGDLEPLAYLFSKAACEICADPVAKQWHSEDYSVPYIFAPPASFALCATCHLRLHKRFNERADWLVFLAHIRAGGYGKEFTGLHSLAQRKTWQSQVTNSQPISLPAVRERTLDGSEWWQHLTLDPESLDAPWARPRPLRPRPDRHAFELALNQSKPRQDQLALLRFHASSPKRTATMRQLAQGALPSDEPSRANLAYGALAHRLATELSWTPENRSDGTPSWMTTVAEGWQPPGKEREFEWVMVPTLAALFE
jgi:hypothetical protein